MKQGCWCFLFLFAWAGLANADVVVEPFIVDDPFFFGLPGQNPGGDFSDLNEFDSSPDFTGEVEIFNPEFIHAGSGDVLFTAQFSPGGGGLTRVDFDMGSGLADSTLNASSLVDSSIGIRGLESDGDSDNITFQFVATFLDGTTASSLSELNISVNNGLTSFSGLDGGLFEVSVTSTGDPVEFEFSASGSSPIQSVSFREIQPDVAGNQLTIYGNRTINFTPIPEPGNVGFTFLILCSLLGKRRRR